jgi:hypothetical protein
MNRRILLTAMALTASIFMLPNEAYVREDREDPEDRDGRKELVCYAWDIFPNERFKLNVREHSPLSEGKEEKDFGHARQTAFSVHGKQVGTCGGDSMVAVDGTVITAKPTRHTTGQIGAHMGIETHSARAGDSCRSLIVECTTTELTATPRSWNCFSRNEFEVFQGASTLTKVDETHDPRCSIFEDGFEFIATPEAVTGAQGPASGRKQ